MKPEIKERVEKIRRGEVPEGYKTTKMGIIPDDWEPKEFNFVFEEKINLISDIKKYPLHSLTIQGGVEPKTKRYERSFLVTKDGDNYKIASKDDFVYNPMNLRFGAIGRHRIDSKISVSGYYNVFQCINGNDPLFMEQFLRDYRLIHLYNKYATGSLIEKKRVHFSQFLKFKLSLPKPKEQQKIAEILSTWDKAIELKEKLIEEEKEFKRGLMQKLLTGDIRFPEFTDEWNKVVIGDIFEEVKRINDEISANIEILTISAKHGFLSQKDKFSKVIAGSSLKKYTHLLQNEFAYNKGNSKTAPFGCIFKLDIKEGLVPFVYICFRPTQMIYVDFFDFYFKHGLLDRQLKRIITSGARSDGLLNVSKDNFFNMKISLPSIEEQKKIGFVLRLIQNEIDNSIAELNQLKEQKRGLMQLLLTGIVRV